MDRRSLSPLVRHVSAFRAVMGVCSPRRDGHGDGRWGRDGAWAEHMGHWAHIKKSGGFKEPESEVRIPDLEGSSKNLSPRSEDPGLTCRGFVKELEVRSEDPGLRGFVKELESEMRIPDSEGSSKNLSPR